MMEIKLHGKYGEGKVATVSDCDYEMLNKYKWVVDKKSKDIYYVTCYQDKKNISMHRFIMGASGNLRVDHINHDTFNNTRENLRVCTDAENAKNTRGRKNTSSIYKGVSWSKMYKRWEVHITVNYKSIFIGLFDSEVEAAEAYDASAIFYHKSFACINFPDKQYPIYNSEDDTPWFRMKTSEYRGVNYNKQSKKWFSRITINKHTVYLGYYDSEIDAAKAYDEAVVRFGLSRSKLNFPDDYPDYMVS